MDSPGEDEIWADMAVIFPVFNDAPWSEPAPAVDPALWESFVRALAKHDMCELLEDIMVAKISEHLLEVAEEFWARVTDQTVLGFDRFKQAVQGLDRDSANMLQYVRRIEDMRRMAGVTRKIYGIDDWSVLLKYLIRATLHSQLPVPKELSAIGDFYALSFKVFYHQEKSSREFNESGEEYHCNGCVELAEDCKCDQIIASFHFVNRILIKLELLERLAGDVLTSLMHKQIESHVQDTCESCYTMCFIEPLEKWLNSVVVGWLNHLYSTAPECPETQSKLITFKRKLNHLLYETYTMSRIDQLFNIIIEYPESSPAITDLKLCLKKTHLRPVLVEKLKATLGKRLLHPGVNTPDIITAYISSIKALRDLDPTGIILETCTNPVRQYLRGREDTMRCVVMSLTEEGPGDLADELAYGDESNQVETNWEEWLPDPIDASDTKEDKERQSWDIISMLVNVYGSKEVFVHEYRNLLADRLLTQYSYNTEKETRYLKLLKLRFDDSQLHYCEVMLRDVFDSKRLNTHLHAEPNFGLNQQELEVTCMILSAQFWPVFKEEKLELPEKIKKHLEIYTKAYEAIKGNRTLCWKPHLGSVNIELELKGRTANYTVTPTHAAIIWHFQEKDQWTIDELSGVLHVPPTVLRRRIGYWQTQGLLKEVATDTFLLVEDSAARTAKNVAASDAMMCEDDEAESIMASAQDQREEELQVFWTYIFGMLKNLESLPLDRIHMMLKMFASQGPSAVECSLQQLKQFLDAKVRDHKLLFSGGFYRLPK
ncbi:anaphase-promoting complex, subunit [Nesidiocoris tenuis]|uniref:Anaphase-promoting complex subunit 2 n=1 Tax=Nesidiocoris tenuis TaxID=355587 RepID=A0ABN7B6U5_9HEMI|nr:anaphase-promoting complex, subunit [Nesidiocoris tenuis]